MFLWNVSIQPKYMAQQPRRSVSMCIKDLRPPFYEFSCSTIYTYVNPEMLQLWVFVCLCSICSPCFTITLSFIWLKETVTLPGCPINTFTHKLYSQHKMQYICKSEYVFWVSPHEFWKWWQVLNVLMISSAEEVQCIHW
jgi:hypothetical protein